MIAWLRWIAVAGVIASASPAWARIELRCYEGPQAVAELKAELKAADQQPVIIGNRTGGVWNVNLFTSDAAGLIGYNIEGNQRYGSGKESTTLCVKGKYRSIIMNDVTKPGIPAWALVGSDAKIAGPLSKGYGAGVHDDTVRTAERNGFHIALGAISRVPTGDSGETDGPLVLVDFNPTDPKRGGGMSVTDGRGVRQGLFDMIDTQYGARGVELIGHPATR
jgi:hypothetical protein